VQAWHLQSCALSSGKPRALSRLLERFGSAVVCIPYRSRGSIELPNKRPRSPRRPLWGAPQDGEVHARLWPAVLRGLDLPGGAGRTDAMLHASSHCTTSCFSVVSADVVRLCTSRCLWAVHPKLGGYAHTK